MNVFSLIVREIRHRKLNFLLATCSVSVAVACLVSAQSFLQIDTLVTDQILSAKETELEQSLEEKHAAAEQAGKDLEDTIRKQMKGLGFNVVILPEKQDLAEYNLDGPSETMPESYVDDLAESKIMTVNHLLPTVAKRIHWEEKETDIILYGTRGEVPLRHRALKKPLLDAVPAGTMVVGFNVHTNLELSQDDKVTLMGKEFTVAKLHSERGTPDDVSVWINLKQAQELLGMQNLVNAILALECGCTGDRITQIRAEIAGILPGTQVIERESKALARAEARAKAKQVAEAAVTREEEHGKATLDAEKEGREALEQQHATLASVLVPLVIVGCVVWIGLLAVANVRQRREEIGILRAIGLGSKHILVIFLGKALVIGLLGGMFGCGIGLAVGIVFATVPWQSSLSQELLSSDTLLITLLLSPIIAPLLAAIASWIPALMAAQQDPAIVLQGD